MVICLKSELKNVYYNSGGNKMSEQNICPVCSTSALESIQMDPVSHFFECPVCGRFEYFPVFAELNRFNLNHLGAYLAYNGFIQNGQEYRYFTTMSKERCDEYRKDFENGDITHGHPVHLSVENVENWYPKTFSDKIDQTLLYMNSHTKHMGENIKLEKENMLSRFFVDRYNYEDGTPIKRTDDAIKSQLAFLFNYLLSESLIISTEPWNGLIFDREITLAPKGYARVDELQKKLSSGKSVLVAMKFGDDTKQLRESIRQGITDAGYVAIFIDEVQHNDFITPELLKYIKDSKFVVVDLSDQNNGAYLEEGYAMGLGKPVIQLCKKGVELHFDVAQKNTIMWETESDIANRLKNRIIATID